MAINPVEYPRWVREYNNWKAGTAPKDQLSSDRSYLLASNEAYYRNNGYNAAPASEGKAGPTPVDLLLNNPQEILLHEVSVFNRNRFVDMLTHCSGSSSTASHLGG